MAKHGGYPMGMMGGGNMQNLMRQAQKMQESMLKKQAELNEKIYTASAGGGMVTVKVNGSKRVESIEINPACVDPEDVEMLQDLVLTATNAAIEEAAKEYEAEMGRYAGGLGL